MPRIAGVNIPENKQILYSLTYIYGIGLTLARKALNQTNIDHTKKAKDLSTVELEKLKNIIEKDFKIEGDLKRDIMMNVKRLKEVGSWRGQRHQKGLPVRGQRTKCNSRTVRGNVRRTMGSGQKRAPAPK